MKSLVIAIYSITQVDIKLVEKLTFLYNLIMQKVLAIVGPTAVGKTSFGIKCAQIFNGEIISGDSIQVYKGLNIGSAKASAEELKMCKHHLIDIKEASSNYSVKEFQELARKNIAEISEKNMLPIIVGGTGLYIKAALYDYEFFEENEEDNLYENLSNFEIYNILQEKDPKALEKIHVNNRKRLVRALNIYEKHNQGISTIKEKQEHKPIYDALIIGLTRDREELYKLIEKRVYQMIDEGLIEEIKQLLNKGITFENQSMQAIGYKEFKDYFNGSASKEDCIQKVITNTKHFAKRQYTRFNHQLNVEWFLDSDEAMKRIKEWYE